MTKAGNWTIESCATVGQGDLILGGSDVGFIAFSGSIPIGPAWYSVEDGANREAGIGEFNGSKTIVRSTVQATLVDGVYDNGNPSPISLSGNATVSCTFNAAAYDEILAHITNISNPHSVQANQIPYDPTNDPVTSETILQDAMLDQSGSIEERTASMSGALSGGLITESSPSQFTISDGVGKIFDSYTDPNNTSVDDVTWAGLSNVTLMMSGSVGSVAIFITGSANILQIPGQIAGVHYRENIFLGVVYFRDGAIADVANAPSIIKQTATDVYDALLKAASLTGSDVKPVDSALSVYIESGVLFYPGINWYVEKTNPNNITVPEAGNSVSPITFYPMTQDGAIGAGLTIIPKQYNDAAANLVNLTGNDATIHRLYSIGVTGREFILLYGQNLYSDANIAKDNLQIDGESTTFPTEIDELLFLANIGIGDDASDFDDVNEAWIVNNDEINGSSGSVTTTDHTTLINRDANNQHPIGSITDLVNRLITWQNIWSAGQYELNDMVRDGTWTMIANKQTNDRPAPQSNGEPLNSLPTVPLWSDLDNASIIYSGGEYTFIQGGWVQSIRVWVDEVGPDISHRLLVVDVNNDTISTLDLSNLLVGQWNTVAIVNEIVPVGAVFQFLLDSINRSGTTIINGDWTKLNDGNSSDPGVGEWNTNITNDLLRISDTDDASADRSAELAAILIDSTITFIDSGDASSFVTYHIDAVPVDQITYFEYEVTQVDIGANGKPVDSQLCNATISVPIPQATKYVEIVDQWLIDPSFATVIGILDFNGAAAGAISDNAYGVDIQFQPGSVSPDWDLVASSESAGGSGGFDDSELVKLDGSRPMTGELILAADPITDLGATPKQYVDAKANSNLIINSDFSVWQRGDTQMTTGYDSVDRYRFGSSGGSTHITNRRAFAVGQSDVPDNPANYCENSVVGAVAASSFSLMSQNIESVLRTSGKTLTLTFNAKANVVLDLSTSYVQFFGSGGSSSNSQPIDKITLATAWQKFKLTFDVDSIAGKSIGGALDDYLGINFWYSGGSDNDGLTGGLPAQTGVFDISNIQVEEGSSATQFEYVTAAQNLLNCQRYFNIYNYFGQPRFRADTALTLMLGIRAPHPVQMRVNPTVDVVASNYDNATFADASANSIELVLRVNPIAAGYFRVLSATIHHDAEL